MDGFLEQLSLIAHEFKTPVDIIGNTAQLILKSVELDRLSDEKLVISMEAIMYYCLRLELLTDNIITASKVEYGYLDSKNVRRDLSEFLTCFIKNVEPFCNKNSFAVSLTNNLKENGLCCDYNMLQTIVLNLVSNAIKYNDKADKKINIILNEDSDSVIITVRDNGIGMSEKTQKTIFDKFARAENFTTRNIEGVGLGLTISKNLAEAMRGSIKVKSKLKTGSEFILTLPKDTLPTSVMYEVDEEYFSPASIMVSLSGIRKNYR